MRKLRILLADDHETVREGLKTICNAQADMEVVAEAADGDTAVAQAKAVHPDVIVMDISMPRLNGLRATETLKAAQPDAKIITLTRHSDDGYLQRLLAAGASGYVLKQSRSSELLHAIRAVAAGGRYLDPSLTDRVIGDYGRRHNAPARINAKTLSPREEQVLKLIARGYSNKEIASELELSVKTVEAHKTKGMQRLGLRTRIDIVKLAVLEGWLEQP
jgi:two-component system, NarL family, response regulator NreC